MLKLAGGYTNLNRVMIWRCSSFKYFNQPKIRIWDMMNMMEGDNCLKHCI